MELACSVRLGLQYGEDKYAKHYQIVLIKTYLIARLPFMLNTTLSLVNYYVILNIIGESLIFNRLWSQLSFIVKIKVIESTTDQ